MRTTVSFLTSPKTVLELLLGICASVGCGSSDPVVQSGDSGGGDATEDACRCCDYKPPPPETVLMEYTRCDLEAGDAEACRDSCFQVCSMFTPGKYFQLCDESTNDAGQAVAVCHYGPPPCGRRPEGLSDLPGATTLGAYLAHAAHLEAASIRAFRRLADELAAFGAPAALVTAAKKAAHDERRHTLRIGRLARRRGGTLVRVKSARPRTRTLFEIARENVVEGCVRETYGALFAVWQSQRAGDPELRNAMRSIAKDEVKHAALARRVAGWARARLSEEDRAALDEAESRAWDDLESEATREPPPEIVHAAGAPRAHDALALVRGLRQAGVA